MDYAYILTYTREDLVTEMTKIAEAASKEEVCMISTIAFEANAALAKLLEDTFRI
ncbi:MAG: hypothetical protein ACI9VM_000533 [Candidatus Azotimanducaceae bacterium]|jgi:hypothetical protein